MSKAQGLRVDSKVTSLDISKNNRILALGGRTLRMYGVDTSSSYWYEPKVSVGNYSKKIPGIKHDEILEISWNKSERNQHLFVILTEGARGIVNIMDATDIQNCCSTSILKSSEEQIQIQKAIWNPFDPNTILTSCTELGQIFLWDIRQPEIIATFDTPNTGINSIKFSTKDENIFAMIGKHRNMQSTYLTLFDIRNNQSHISKNETRCNRNEKDMFFDWEPNGNRIISVYEGILDIHEPNGGQMKHREVCKVGNAHGIKWLKPRYDKKKKTKIENQILVGETDSNVLKLLNLNTNEMDELKIDKNQKIISWVLADEEDLIYLSSERTEKVGKKKKGKEPAFNETHEVMGVFFTEKRKYEKINHSIKMGSYNELFFKTHHYNEQEERIESLALLKEREETAVHIEPASQEERLRRIKDREDKLLRRQEMKAEKRLMKIEKRDLQEQYQNQSQQNFPRSLSSKRLQTSVNPSKKSLSNQSRAMMKSFSGDNPKAGSKKSKSKSKEKSIEKRHPLFLMKSMSRMHIEESSSSNESSEEDISIEEKEFVMDYKEELEYFEMNYIIDPATESWKNLCQHNSKVALQIGKKGCAEFWIYLISLINPDKDQIISMESVFEDQLDLRLELRENKVFAMVPDREELESNILDLDLQQYIQNLIDDHELQTAVLASVAIRKKDPNLLNENFIENIMYYYKRCLTDHGLIHCSNILAMKASLTELVRQSPSYFEFKIKCGACHSYRSSNLSKCECELVCVFCGDPLNTRSIIICSVCGHAGHTLEYKKYFKEQGNTICPFPGCIHHCFKAHQDKPCKWKKSH